MTTDLTKPPSAELASLVDRAAYYGKSMIAEYIVRASKANRRTRVRANQKEMT